jgi:hypothetical protein
MVDSPCGFEAGSIGLGFEVGPFLLDSSREQNMILFYQAPGPLRAHATRRSVRVQERRGKWLESEVRARLWPV